MSKTTTEMQLISIDKLVPYVNNARTHSAEQIIKLRSSLREFGFVNPIIVDREFNVIAGHGRLMAAKEEGISEVPCVFVDYLTESQKKAYILADNRMAMDAGWDEELLKIEMEELQNLGYDLGYTGFDEKELADLFGIDDKDVKGMDVIPFEKYDYLLIVCRTELDYTNLLGKFGMDGSEKAKVTDKKSIKARAVWYNDVADRFK